MGFVPTHQEMDTLQAECGEEHAIFDWKRDCELRRKWPTRKRAEAQGSSHRFCVACYHWRAISERSRLGVFLKVADSWTDPAVACQTDERYALPIVVIRVHIPDRKSQYLGWLTVEQFHKINTVNWSWQKEVVRYRRVILQAHLSMGFPKETQKQLFEDE